MLCLSVYVDCRQGWDMVVNVYMKLMCNCVSSCKYYTRKVKGKQRRMKKPTEDLTPKGKKKKKKKNPHSTKDIHGAKKKN